MRLTSEGILLSPTDLAAFAACPHLTALESSVARGELARPYRLNPHAALIQEKGREHERDHLESLRVRSGELVEPGDAAETEAAVCRGVDVVYQAVLEDPAGWRGKCDFLLRIDEPSALGEWSYEPADTKLARAPQPEHVLQLCFYAERTGALQGQLPELMKLILGTGADSVLRTSDFIAYYRRLRERLMSALDGAASTYPYPVEHCGLCDYFALCTKRWEEDDHLTLVAGIQRSQVERLTAAGIGTLEKLATSEPDARPRRIARQTFAGLRQQAALQLEGRRTGEHVVELLPSEPDRGFALLPEPHEGDVYLDLEGHPFYEPARGLEYLFGLLYREQGELVYEAIWARDREAERVAFERAIDFVYERRERHPGLHVYHYGAYERSQLGHLMGEHGTREEEFDELLRGGVLVDLYRVLRQSLRASVSSYSIKRMEEFYDFRRTASVSGGTASIILFEEWVETGVDDLLDGIRDYNEEDCRSLELLHRWLLGLRPSDLEWRPEPPARELTDVTLELLDERERLKQALLEGAAEGEPRWLLAQLLEYHRREAKPAWWKYFHNRELDEEELLEDSETIGGIQSSGDPIPDGRSLVYTLSFPAQEHKIRGQAVDPATGKLCTVTVDDGSWTIRLRRGTGRAAEPLPRALMPTGPLDDKVKQLAVQRFAEDYLDGAQQFPALRDLIERRPPDARLDGNPVEAASSLGQSYLFVQGPPGSGKTYVGARMAVDLMRKGKRVGITAQSHNAIHNFLAQVEEAAHECGFVFAGRKKSSDDNTYPSQFGFIDDSKNNDDLLDPSLQLLAGTAWLFSRPAFEHHLDVLFIDEGGQFSLADAIAVGTSAHSLVLLGDPNQLAQVSQGAHPPGAGSSALEHLLGDDQTVRPDMGIFLETTWRLRPELCRYISQAFYEDRLHPNEKACSRSLEGANGIHFLPVEHEGNRQRSLEEADAIQAAIESLVGTSYTDEDGERQLAHGDILVVAPYNSQVRLLQGQLPAGVRVGTVDKFQGQEAPVIFYSMASSSSEDIPHGLEFLFSRNRLNVAISRAKCLAVLVASPRLLDASCKTIDQMRLANAMCLLVEMAESVGSAESRPS